MPNGLRKLGGAIAVATLLCGVAGTASADSALRRALSRVPAKVAMDRSGIAASFVGLSELRRLYAGDVSAMRRRVGLGDSDTAKAFFSSDEASWKDNTGLKRDEIASFTEYGTPPRAVVLWSFADAGLVDPFVEGLGKRGFSQAGGIWRNGEPLKVDFTKRNPNNPFLGPLGRASMLAPFANGVAQSPDPGAAAEAGAVSAKTSLAGLAPIEAALDAIEKEAARSSILQAIVLTPAIWMQGDDVMDMMATSPTVDKKALADKMAERAKKPPTPVSLGVVIADVETREPASNGVVIALPYGDCDTAREGARIFADKWKNAAGRDGQTGAQRTGRDPSVTVYQGKEACVALLSLVGTPDAERGNSVLRYITGAIWQRDFKPLQGG
ncbi:hypothetical protein FZC33_14050 [Labrys sp. KNU-23]|uniref:hypothetical protein n=1 Tax=Labrys sp. KNU-23 TaxID=2789216 RepID=UPI0011F018AE|nr:hypothetical protein [Labrys sp. KNU-23]QEN87380.1 hypothetical protein FZC33_14050 [Labrys sp. KNU-23]